MKNKLLELIDKLLLRKSSIIETINDQLKNIPQIEHSRHPSIYSFIINLVCGLIAYTYQPKSLQLVLLTWETWLLLKFTRNFAELRFINPLHSGGSHTGVATNINQTSGSSISSGGLYYSFSSDYKNLTWAAQRAAASVTAPLVYAYKNSSKIKQRLYQLASATSRKGIINGLHMAARARCSPDRTLRL